VVKPAEPIRDAVRNPPRPSTSRSAKWHQRRLEVIDTSATVFARRGFHGTGLIELCEANQLSKGALYYYIGSKEQLLEAINDRLLDEMMLGADRVQRSGGSPAEQLAMLGTEYMNVMVRFQDHATVMIHDYPALTGEYAKRFTKRRREYETRIEAIIQEGIDAGDFRQVDLYHAAQAWIGTQTHMWRMAESSRSAHGYSSTVEDIFVRGISR
jgi:TetR/AcrR family transcriptional regulator, cholesterol catabolism regulator